MKFTISDDASPAVLAMLEGVHWAIVYDRLGHAQPFGPGCFFYVVVDKTKAEGVIPLLVTHMSKGTMHARCACGQEECSRQVKMSFTWSGKHPQKFSPPAGG